MIHILDIGFVITIYKELFQLNNNNRAGPIKQSAKELDLAPKFYEGSASPQKDAQRD